MLEIHIFLTSFQYHRIVNWHFCGNKLTQSSWNEHEFLLVGVSQTRFQQILNRHGSHGVDACGNGAVKKKHHSSLLARIFILKGVKIQIFSESWFRRHKAVSTWGFHCKHRPGKVLENQGDFGKCPTQNKACTSDTERKKDKLVN